MERILQNNKIGIIGLGYVGLPLAVAFGKKIQTFGFDTNQSRITDLAKGYDATRECSQQEITAATHLSFSACLEELAQCNVYIVTVPTPIDEHKQPDLTSLIKASQAVGSIISQGNVIIYESTVYPGATEEECIPIIEQVSGLRYNKDFFAGYTPERINPGEKHHRVTDILKITSGSTPETAEFIDQLYKRIITAGTYRASSIKVAEAAKVIENTQRDVNIALINELSIIFNRLHIDTLEVLEAAGTKWNFLPFRPGLVGGHCIGVDTYYLTHKAQSVGYHPEMILAGRRLNDAMGHYVAAQLVKKMLKKGIHVDDANVLLMGLTFKENCPDLRNTKVVDIITELKEYNINIDIIDPWCSNQEAQEKYNLKLAKNPQPGYYDAVIIAVSHNEFKTMGCQKIHALGKPNHIIYDLKYVLEKDSVDMRL